MDGCSQLQMGGTGGCVHSHWTFIAVDVPQCEQRTSRAAYVPRESAWPASCPVAQRVLVMLSPGVPVLSPLDHAVPMLSPRCPHSIMLSPYCPHLIMLSPYCPHSIVLSPCCPHLIVLSPCCPHLIMLSPLDHAIPRCPPSTACSRSWPPWPAAHTWWQKRCCRCGFACNEVQRPLLFWSPACWSGQSRLVATLSSRNPHTPNRRRASATRCATCWPLLHYWPPEQCRPATCCAPQSRWGRGGAVLGGGAGRE